MGAFFDFLKVLVSCGTVFFVAMLILLALPQSRLRSVGLEMLKWMAAAGLVLLTASPVDIIPDILPVVGWADDVGYVIGAVAAARSALGERRQRAYMDN